MIGLNLITEFGPTQFKPSDAKELLFAGETATVKLWNDTELKGKLSRKEMTVNGLKSCAIMKIRRSLSQWT